MVYVGNLKDENRTYVAETDALVKLFMEKYELPEGSIIFGDGGKSTRGIGDLGFKAHYYYPSAVHAYLSPNDNGLHGPCKRRWRTKFTEFKDDVKCSLYLLHQMDTFDEQQVKSWFDRNFFRQGSRPAAMTDEAVDALMGKEFKRAKFFRACSDMYDIYVRGDPTRGKGHLVKRPEQLGEPV